MTHCPNVKSIDFCSFREASAEDWGYFSAVLMNSGVWKLRSLPYLYDKSLHFANYFNCAHYLRHSLTKLNLTQGMIGRRHCSFLLEFTQLTKLTLGDNILKDVYDCDNMLKYLPQLEQFTVGSFENTNNKNNTVDTFVKLVTNRTYTNMKKLDLSQYTTVTNNELLYIMQRFPSLDELQILGIASITWPETTISLPIMKSFFKFLHTIPDSSISIAGLTGDIQLWNTYDDTSENNMERDIKHLSISFLDASYSYTSGADFHMSFFRRDRYHHSYYSAMVLMRTLLNNHLEQEQQYTMLLKKSF